MITNAIFSAEPSKRREAMERLIQGGSPRKTFFLMITLSIALATLGLLIDNVPVIIGAMLVAPMLSPVLCVGMGVVIVDYKLIRFSIFAVLKAIILSVIVAVLIALIVGAPGSEGALIYQMEPNYVFICIALISGLAAAFAWGHPEMGAALPGVAISVALIPPLAAVGIGTVLLDWQMIQHSAQLFILNLICIILISILVFHLMGFYKERKSAERAIKKEEKILKEE
ncbi:DUF389 domain-containing protein [Patescibacteria group bacterium]|nr:DUF389 domain-containing protein [Patescibacteria group bacterium]